GRKPETQKLPWGCFAGAIGKTIAYPIYSTWSCRRAPWSIVIEKKALLHCNGAGIDCTDDYRKGEVPCPLQISVKQVSPTGLPSGDGPAISGDMMLRVMPPSTDSYCVCSVALSLAYCWLLSSVGSPWRRSWMATAP